MDCLHAHRNFEDSTNIPTSLKVYHLLLLLLGLFCVFFLGGEGEKRDGWTLLMQHIFL